MRCSGLFSSKETRRGNCGASSIKNKPMYKILLAFIVYASRSGSTLLASLLDSHPEIAVATESGFLVDILLYCPKIFSTKTELFSCINILEKNHQYVHLNINSQKVLLEFWASGLRRSSDLILFFLQEYFSNLKPDAHIWILKEGIYLYYFRVIKKIFPYSKFIHIYRDGRGMYNSKKHSLTIFGKSMSNSPVLDAVIWKKTMKVAEKFVKSDDFLEIKFENFLLRKELELKRLWDFLGVENKDISIKAESGYSRRIRKEEKHLHLKAGKNLDACRINAWQTELNPREILCFEIIAGKMLQKRDYEILNNKKLGISRHKKYCLKLYSYYSLLLKNIRVGLHKLIYLKKPILTIRKFFRLKVV